MRNVLVTFLIALFYVCLSYSQDKIIKRSGDTLRVQITKSTPELIEFNYTNETLVNIEYKNAIVKIIYSNGREENCSQKNQLQKINGPEDWKKVVITYTESDIKGLTKVKQITKTSGWGGSMATGLGYNDALKMIKKEAAKLGACIVWITDKPNEQTTEYGAGVKLTGIAYK